MSLSWISKLNFYFWKKLVYFDVMGQIYPDDMYLIFMNLYTFKILSYNYLITGTFVGTMH